MGRSSVPEERDTGLWHVTINELMNAFREALAALVPYLERVKIPTRSTGLVDSWDDITENLFYYFVIEAARMSLPDGSGDEFRWAEYETQYSSYDRLGCIQVVPTLDHAGSDGSSKEYVFHGYETEATAMDTVLCREIDESGTPLGDQFVRFPWTNVRYVFVYRSGRGKIVKEDLTVEL